MIDQRLCGNGKDRIMKLILEDFSRSQFIQRTFVTTDIICALLRAIAPRRGVGEFGQGGSKRG
jgi:hypothetical protein